MTEHDPHTESRVGPADPVDMLSSGYFRQAQEDFAALGDSLQPTDGLRNFKHGAILEFDPARAMTLAEIRTEFGEKLCANYDEMLTMLEPARPAIESVLADRSLIITANHPTLATPAYPALALAEMFGEEIRKQIYVVIGPYPATFRIDVPGIATLDPLHVLNSMGGVLLTSPVSSGSDKHSQTLSLQKQMRRNFIADYEELAGEPGNIIIMCSGGSRDHEVSGGIRYVKEDKSRNGHKLIARTDSSTLPLGVHDHVFGARNSAGGYASRIDMVPGNIHQLGTLKIPGYSTNMAAQAIMAETISLANLAAHQARKQAHTDTAKRDADYCYVAGSLRPAQ